MRTRKFLYNSAMASIQQLVVALIGFIVPKIMLQHYGSETNGLVSSINQFVSYLLLVEAGLAGASVYALYQPLAEGDHKAINGVISAANRFYRQTGILFLGLIIAFSSLYPFFVQTETLSPVGVGVLVFVLGAPSVLEFFVLSKYRVLLTADQKTYIVSAATIAQVLINTAIIVFLARSNVNIVLLKAISLLSFLARSIILTAYVKRNYTYVNYDERPNFKALDKRWDALYLQALGVTQRGAPVVLATIYTTLKHVSVYSIFNMVLAAINNILSVFMSGLSSSFGDVIARGEKEVLQKSYDEFEFAYYSLITIVYSITLVTIMPFIRLYTVGVVDVNYDQPILGFLFVLNGWLYNVKTPQGMLVISAGLYKETRIQSTIQALIIVLFALILTPKWGLPGILVASCLSNMYRDIDLIWFIPKHVTMLPVRNTVVRVFRMIVAVFFVWVPFFHIEVQSATFVQWVTLSIIVGIYAVAIVLTMALLFEKEQFYSLLHRLRATIGRKQRGVDCHE